MMKRLRKDEKSGKTLYSFHDRFVRKIIRWTRNLKFILNSAMPKSELCDFTTMMTVSILLDEAYRDKHAASQLLISLHFKQFYIDKWSQYRLLNFSNITK